MREEVEFDDDRRVVVFRLRDFQQVSYELTDKSVTLQPKRC
jgi:hypothetical protein